MKRLLVQLLLVFLWASTVNAVSSLTIGWQDNASNEDGFTIERATSIAGPFSQITTVSANVTSYTDTNLADATSFCYRVNAFNTTGASPYTPVVCGTTKATLNFVKAGTGAGQVMSAVVGINCTATCTTQLDGNSSVTLTATAAAGSVFAGWSGACTGTGSCTITMNSAMTVTATFNAQAVQTFILTVAKAGTGSGTVTATGISCGSDCSENYNSGTAVTLTAAVLSGSAFTGWSGACSGTGSCTVTMNAQKSVTANFASSAPPTGGGTTGTGSNGGTASSDFGSASTRASVQKGDQVMIGGFVIEGSQPAIVLIRGRGPSMGDKPIFVPGTLSNPQLQIFSGSTLIAYNDNWQDSPQCASQFECGGAAQILATGLDPCQPNPGLTGAPAGCAFESAILMIVPPGAYTAVLTGVNGETGVGLVEVFEINAAANTSSLVNISTRALVRSKDDVVIGGVVLTGSESKTVLVRGRGPSMGAAPFYVPGVLSNPQLQLFSGSTMIAQNDNWQDSPQCDARFGCGGAAQIKAVGMDPCEPNPGESSAPPDCSKEAVLLITLPPGAYTAVMRGVAGATGVALIEIYDLN